MFRAEFNPQEEMGEQLDFAIEGILAPAETDEEGAYIRGKKELSEEEESRIRSRLTEIIGKLPDIDGQIADAAEGWSFARIGKAELAILRLAIYEMQSDDDVPVRVAINEAVELSKVYCNEDARAFVNGVLGKVSGER